MPNWGKSGLEDPAKKQTAIELLAQGKSEAVVAEAVETSQSSIHRLKVQNRDKIELEAQRIIDKLPSMIDQDVLDMDKVFEIKKYLYHECDTKKTEVIGEGKNAKVVTTCDCKDPAPHLPLAAKFKIVELIEKKIDEYKKAFGIYTGQSSPIFNLIFQQKNTFLSNPMVQKFLDEHDAQIYELTKDDYPEEENNGEEKERSQEEELLGKD